MSKVESVNFCNICYLAFETKKQFIKHNLSDEHLKRARKEYEDEVEDEIRERVYDVEEDDYILKPKTITKDNTKEINITHKGGNFIDYIEDIDGTTNNSLEEIKNCYQFRKVKRLKYQITAECYYKKRNKEEV